MERFIDENRSRNEQLADIMRRFGICEEKGSGIDKVVSAAEVFQLPAPDFRVGDTRTEGYINQYPTPDQLWEATFSQASQWRDRFFQK